MKQLTVIAHWVMLGWLSTLTPCISAEQPGPWQRVKMKDGITVYQREVPGWSIKEVRATGQVSAPIQRVRAVVEDITQANRINSVVSSAGLIPLAKHNQTTYFVILDMPWPTSDRSAIYQRQVTTDSSGNTITVEDRADTATKPVPPMKKTVRIERSTQQWVLRKVNANLTEVTFTSLTDPNGPIPASLINTRSVEAPLESIANLRLLCK